MDIAFKDLVKYAKMKNINGSNIKELLQHKDLVHKIEELREEDANLDEVVDRLQRCDFSKKELDRIRDLFESYFGLEEDMTEQEIIAEKFGISLDKVDTVKLDNGEEVYRVIGPNNKDIVLRKDDKNNNLEDELEEYSDSVNFDSNLETNTEDAAEYQRIHGFNELSFYTKEEINRKPELLDNLTIEQIEEVRALIKMDNVVFINVECGLGLGANHQLIHADYNSFKGTISVSDTSHENSDSYEEIEELELFDESAKAAPEREYADLVSTTELPVIDEKMVGYYENHYDELEDLEEKEQKVYKRKIDNDTSDRRGFVGYAILISIIALIGIVVTVLKIIL